MTFQSLIATLEAAREGSRQLDAEIHVATKAQPDAHRDLQSCKDCGCAPHYTTSLDVAPTLAPQGWEWEMRFNDNKAYAEIGDPNLFCVGEASTSALAFCIAALKARAAMGSE